MNKDNNNQKELSENDFRRRITPEQYRILREKGTEMPFSGKYVHTKDKGIYKCAACGNQLFSSETKFDSDSGWPSFTDPMNLENIELKEDRSHGMMRTEVICRKCGSHLGHVFEDGPGESGKRYCINSVCLELEPRSKTTNTPSAKGGSASGGESTNKKKEFVDSHNS